MINIHEGNGDKMCPLLRCACQKEQCAWFVSKVVPRAFSEEDQPINACAMQLLGNGINVIASVYSEGIAV
jgi:hypothetical protein